MIVIVGAGKFGQTIATLLGNTEHALVDIEADGTYSANSQQKLANAARLILCVPSGALESCCQTIKEHIDVKTPILNCTKGLYDNLETPSHLIKRTLSNPIASLMGPNLSVEINAGKPTMAAIAGDDADTWARILHSDRFAIVVEDDLEGIEFGGAIKNIIALGVGLIHGYFGDNSYNTMGSLLAFGLRDAESLYQAKNNRAIPRLAFISDLFATCSSDTSRNHQHGHKLGESLLKGERPPVEGTIEGLRTLTIAFHYAQKHGLHVPLITALHKVFAHNGTMDDVLETWRYLFIHFLIGVTHEFCDNLRHGHVCSSRTPRKRCVRRLYRSKNPRSCRYCRAMHRRRY